jgi:uncharacterized protein YcbK (DUF882 family)
MTTPPHAPRALTRRAWLNLGAAALLTAALPARAATPPVRRLAFKHLHTGEQLSVEFFRAGRYQSSALTAINHLLRDFRTDQTYPIDRDLLDQLCVIHQAVGSDAPFEIISAYRSPATNQMLRGASTGVASGSLHLQGRAIDIRLADTPTRHLRDVAQQLALGGVGYYPSSNFVHLDIGRPRHW